MYPAKAYKALKEIIIGSVTKMVSMATSEHGWYATADLRKYTGQWVIIKDNQVVLSGENIKKLLKEFKTRFPTSKPFVARVPSKKIAVW